MLEFIGLIVIRALSGIQNGFGYAGKRYSMLLTSMALMAGVGSLVVAISMSKGTLLEVWQVAAAIAFLIIAFVGIFGVADEFIDSISVLPFGIHFWEYVILPATMACCWIAGGNIWYIILSVYPGLILHKMAINVGSGLPLWSDRTDDPDGKWVGIPELGIRIPRLGMNIRAVLAAISIIIFLILYL